MSEEKKRPLPNATLWIEHPRYAELAAIFGSVLPKQLESKLQCKPVVMIPIARVGADVVIDGTRCTSEQLAKLMGKDLMLA